MKYTQNISNSERIKAMKVFIGGLIAVYISKFFKEASGTTMSLTVFLLIMMSPTISGSREYLKKRLLGNVYAFFITVILHHIFKGNLYGLPIVFLVLILSCYCFKLQDKISLISSGAAAMIFYMSTGGSSIASRFISILVGSAIAILVNELILPVNYGKLVDGSIVKISKEILEVIEFIIRNNGDFHKEYGDLNRYLNELSKNINSLKSELDITLGGIHLKKYSDRLNYYKQLEEVLLSAKEYIYIMYSLKKEFVGLEDYERKYIIEITKLIYENHKIIFDNLNNREEKININIDFEINSSKLDMNKKTNILIMSKLIQYANKINSVNNLGDR